MGCELTKLALSERDHHDAINRPAPPSDPRSPLTTKQQYCMKASWKGIYREIEKTGVLLFIKLFEENEHLLSLFAKFEALHATELHHSEELAEHAMKVMNTLNQGIQTLDKVDDFFAYIRHIGATHHQVPGFTSDNFWKIEKPFLQAAKTTLGDRYTPNIENIYKLTIKFILENLVKGFEEPPDKELEILESKSPENGQTANRDT